MVDFITYFKIPSHSIKSEPHFLNYFFLYVLWSLIWCLSLTVYFFSLAFSLQPLISAPAFTYRPILGAFYVSICEQLVPISTKAQPLKWIKFVSVVLQLKVGRRFWNNNCIKADYASLCIYVRARKKKSDAYEQKQAIISVIVLFTPLQAQDRSSHSCRSNFFVRDLQIFFH